MTFALIFLAVFTLYLRTLCPTLSSGDTGELIASALLLDVSHPPGHGLLALAFRLAMETPAGGLIFRAGLLSACAGALACAQLFSAASKLGAGRPAALAGTAALAAVPYLWWQSTMPEKYAIQMALALFVLNSAFGRKWLLAAFAFALALTHHPQAVMLFPVVVWAAWKEFGHREGPSVSWYAIVIPLVLVLLPLSLRAVYPAVRAEAIQRSETGLFEKSPEPAANWGEPSRAGALLDYLSLDYYSTYLEGKVRLARAPFREHLGHYPGQLTWPGLALALFGLILLAGKDGLKASALAASVLLIFAFSMRFPLVPKLSVSYHQNALLVLSLLSCLGLDGLLSRTRGGGRARVAIMSVLLIGILARGSALSRVHDASRHLFFHDFNSSVIRLAPPGAVVLSAYEYDCFAVVCFQRSLGLRPDLIPLLIPQRATRDHFVIRRGYRAFAAARLPEAVLNFTDQDSGPHILRRILLDNSSGFCFAASGLSDPVVPHQFFSNRATIYVARDGNCGEPDPERAWRAVSTRSWFGAGRDIPTHMTVIDFFGQMLMRSARDPGVDPPGRIRFLARMTRLLPDEPAAWLALAKAQRAAALTDDSFRSIRRAIELDPAAPDGHLALIRLMIRSGAQSAASSHLETLFAVEPYRDTRAAEGARRLLSLASLGAALPSVWSVFAEVALDRARETPENPELLLRRIYLARLAADLAPDWSEAQRECAALLLRRARYAEARKYISRFTRLEPGSPGAKAMLRFLETGGKG